MDLRKIDDHDNIRAGYLDMEDLFSVRYRVPYNQRQYVWRGGTGKEVHLYFQSLLGAYKNRETLFLGQTIWTHDGAEYSVVDGQQRLVTSTLLLIALRNKAKLCLPSKETDSFVTRINQLLLDGNRTRLTGVSAIPAILLPDPNIDPIEVLIHTSSDDIDIVIDRFSKAGEGSPCIRIAGAYKDLAGYLDSTSNLRLDSLEGIRDFTNYILTHTFFLGILFTDPCLAEDLFTGLNARGVKLTNSENIKNLFASIIGKNAKGLMNAEGKKWLRTRWEILEIHVAQAKSYWGSKFPDVDEFLYFLVLLEKLSHKTTSPDDSSMIKQIAGFNQSKLLNYFQEVLTEKPDHTSRADYVTYFVENSIKVLRQMLSINTMSDTTKQEVGFSLESIGESMRLLFGFLIPIAFAFSQVRENKATSEADYIRVARSAETSAFRVFSLGTLNLTAFKQFELRAASRLLTSPVSIACSAIDQEASEITNDTKMLRLLAQKSFGGSSGPLAFYVLQVIERRVWKGNSYSVKQKNRYEIEHIVPQKNLRKAVDKPFGWYFKISHSAAFERQSLNQIGNLMVVRSEVNQHIANKNLTFKWSKQSSCSANCESHFQNEIAFSKDPLFSMTPAIKVKACDAEIELWKERHGTYRGGPLGVDARFNRATEMVKLRSKALATLFKDAISLDS